VDPERWQQIKEVFGDAVQREPSLRAAFLAEACADDRDLRAEVEKLLNSSYDTDFIAHPTVAEVGKTIVGAWQQLNVGQRLGRYRITQPLGKGGMGEVYLAHDTELERDVALKILPVEVAGNRQRMQRFIQEARTASALNHQNIITIYEVGQADGVRFIATEYIKGETLRQRLRRGSLSLRECFEVAVQTAAALSAAHEAKIVHRDIKPENIMLRPDGLVKVLDFGLAKLTEKSAVESPDPYAATRPQIDTAPGVVLGTFNYMSPEQARGKQVDARTDIWSLGVVLYEIIAGRQPFEGETNSDILAAILKTDPEPLAQVAPATPAELQHIVGMALQRDKEARYQTANDLLADLKGLQEDLAFAARLREAPIISQARAPTEMDARRTAEENKKKRHYFVLAFATLIVLLVLLAMGFYLNRTRRIQETATNTGLAVGQIKPRRSVAVLGFKNLSGNLDAAWLSTALSEMLSTELAAGEEIRMIPGENVARMRIELSLADTDSFAKDTLAQIKKNLGTDVVVLGSYVTLGEKRGGQIRLDLRLQDVAAGETIGTVVETGTEANLFELVSRAGQRLRDRLGVAALSGDEANRVLASLPSNPEAARHYAEGLERLRLFDAQRARELFEKAIAADPKYPMAYSALAAAWTTLGYNPKAREAAKKAFDLSGNLSREERLVVEGRYQETFREWENAAGTYHTLLGLFPDNLEYGLRLVFVQTFGGKTKEALATIESLRKLPSPARDDPRIDLSEMAAAQELSDFKLEQAAATRAAEKAAAQGARLLLARARLFEGWALHSLGENERAIAVSNEAKQIYAGAGDRRGVANALGNVANVLWREGDLAGAKKMFNESLQIRREIGEQRGVAVTLNNLAGVLLDEGKLRDGTRMFQEAIANYRAVNDRGGLATTLHNLGGVLRDQASLVEARKNLEEAQTISREIGDEHEVVTASVRLEEVLFDQGDLAEAKKLSERALAFYRETNDDKTLWAAALYDQGMILLAEGNLAGARQEYDESLAINNETGAKAEAAISRLALAALSIEESHFAEAEATAREVAEILRAAKFSIAEGQACVILSQALVAQGKVSDADKAISRANELLGTTENRGAHIELSITTAQVRAASGHNAEAARILDNALAAATKLGLVRLQFEARLVHGKIELQGGSKDAGRVRLAALEKEANAKGFGLIARKAATLRG